MECEKFRADYYSFIENDFEAISPESLEHLRSCPQCRRHMAQLEQAVAAPSKPQPPLPHEHLAVHFRLLGQTTDCQAVKPFLPSLAMTSLPVCVQTPVTAHLEACRACRADYQTLRTLRLTDEQLLEASRFLAVESGEDTSLSVEAKRVLSAIRRRPPSGVTTCATFSEQDDTHALQVAATIPAAARTAVHSRRSFRVAASGLAAAVVLTAALLMIPPMTVRALDMQHLYQSLADVQNLSIRTTTPDEDQPLQHIWISHSQGLQLFESPDKTVLYDLNKKTMTVRDNVLATVSQRPAESASPDYLQLPWGLLPFRDITQLSKGYVWKQVDTESVGQIVVYELSWTETPAGGLSIDRKWVGHLDRQTHLPEKIEWYERFGGQPSYTLMMTMTITYPDTPTVLEAVQNAELGVTQGDQM